MNIAVLGTGAVGQALAGRLHDLGHSVVLGTRDPEATRGRTDEGGRPCTCVKPSGTAPAAPPSSSC